MPRDNANLPTAHHHDLDVDHDALPSTERVALSPLVWGVSVHSRSPPSPWLAVFSALCALTSVGCNPEPPAGQGGQPDASVSVTVSPQSIFIDTGASEQFRAEVTGSSNVTVSWGVNGIDGGSATLGTITQGGLFTAPAQAAAGMQVTVTARSEADPSKTANASVEITPVPGLTLSPVSPHVAAGAQKQFTATAFNLVDSGVTWFVDGIPGGSTGSGTITDGGLYSAPLSARSVTVTAMSVVANSASASTDVSVLAPHPFGVRSAASGTREFFLRATGETLRPRGNNYIRLATQTDFGNRVTTYHSTFNSGLYDAARAEVALSAMQASGYTVVRVFLNSCCHGSMVDDAGALSSTYMDNLTDFLGRAKTQGLSVIITFDWLPPLGPYAAKCPQYPAFDGVNVLNLCGGGVDANVLFHRAYVQALIDRGAPLEAIFAYELRNEYYNDSSFAPLSWTSGTITTANGQAYDMADAGSRQQMMDDGLVYSTNLIGAAIRELDPTALVTVGFFWPQTPNPTRLGDPRVIEVYPAVAATTADFVDLHLYPIAGDLTLPQLVENYGFVPYLDVQPVLMGEAGAFILSYATAAEAAAALKAWQISSCAYGFNGWLVWTWDTDEQGNLWNARSAGGAIDQALAPRLRPDPCVP
jgi:hypothetical protein